MVTFLITPHSQGRKLGVEALPWGTACGISQCSTSFPSPTVPGPHPLKGNPQMPSHPLGTQCGSNVPLMEATRDHSPSLHHLVGTPTLLCLTPCLGSISSWTMRSGVCCPTPIGSLPYTLPFVFLYLVVHLFPLLYPLLCNKSVNVSKYFPEFCEPF